MLSARRSFHMPNFLKLTEKKATSTLRNFKSRTTHYKIERYYEKYRNIISISDIEDRLKNLETIHKTTTETKTKLFILNAMKDTTIKKNKYLTIEEIAIFVSFLRKMFVKIIKTEKTGEIPNLLSLNYYSVVQIYELFFTNLYNTMELNDDVYNSLMEVLDEELKNNHDNSQVEEIYINCLIDCFLITPLSKFGNSDTDIEFFTTYLGYMALNIFTKETDEETGEETTLNDLVELFSPLDWHVIRRTGGTIKNKKSNYR